MGVGHLRILLTTPIFSWLVCLLLTVLYECFINSRYKSCTDTCIANIFLPVANLPFHFLNGVFGRTEILNFDEVRFVSFFFYGSHFIFPHKKSLPI